MTAKFRSRSNSPFDGSLSNDQLAAVIGRCLQSWYEAQPKEPLPEELATLVHRLREQDRADPRDEIHSDGTWIEP
jgi:hypothetical protein